MIVFVARPKLTKFTVVFGAALLLSIFVFATGKANSSDVEITTPPRVQDTDVYLDLNNNGLNEDPHEFILNGNVYDTSQVLRVIIPDMAFETLVENPAVYVTLRQYPLGVALADITAATPYAEVHKGHHWLNGSASTVYAVGPFGFGEQEICLGCVSVIVLTAETFEETVHETFGHTEYVYSPLDTTSLTQTAGSALLIEQQYIVPLQANQTSTDAFVFQDDNREAPETPEDDDNDDKKKKRKNNNSSAPYEPPDNDDGGGDDSPVIIVD